MIIAETSNRGKLHEQYGVANQDRCTVFKVRDTVCAVLCDGVSLNSQMQFSHSEIAASFCAKKMKSILSSIEFHKLSHEELSEVLPDAFDLTEKALRRYLNEKGIDPSDSMTTMIALFYRKGALYAGIAGDGGILYQRKDGSIAAMFTQIKTSSAVWPLSSRKQWKFFSSVYEGASPVGRIVAATDGVFDTLFYLNSNNIAACSIQNLRALFSISKVHEKRRDEALRKLVAQIPSNDDLSCVIIEDPHNFRHSTKRKNPDSH